MENRPKLKFPAHKIYLLAAFLITSFDGYSLPSDSINRLSDQLIKRDSLIHVLSDKYASSELQNSIISTALNTNNNIFSGLSTYFAVISILLTLIVICLPVINYFFVLKPATAAMKKLSSLETEVLSKIENNFENYLLQLEDKNAKKLIKSLVDGHENIHAFTDFFLLRSYKNFDDQDQNTVIDFLEKYPEVSVIDRQVLNTILRSRPSRTSELYYKKVLEIGDRHNYEYAIKYLVDNYPETNMKFFELIIPSSKNGHKILNDLVQYAVHEYIGTSTLDLKKAETRVEGQYKIELFLNNEIICDSVENKEVAHGRTRIIFSMFPQKEFIKQTYYYKKYNKERH